jgi:hypothetical protein
VLAAPLVIVVARESDPRVVLALQALCASCSSRRSPAVWQDVLGGLAIGEAAILPVTDEAHGDLKRIRLAPRLMPHVRHQAKYIDVPVSESHAFVVWRNGAPTGGRIRTLRGFVDLLEAASAEALQGHLQRGDFARWITDVFGDYPLAERIRRLEREYRAGTLIDTTEAMAQAVRSRYEFVDTTLGPL